MKNMEKRSVEFTKMSSKGQIVIPQGIREKLRVKEGTPFAVSASENTIVLKKVEIPNLTFRQAAKPFEESAKRTGFTQKDLEKLIAETRASK